MKKILVIEDDSAIRKNLIKLLKREGFDTLDADNGWSGVQLAQTQAPDLILCDIKMPELNGYEVLEILQQDPATALIPFICLTAFDERASLRQMMELGANDYLTKPFILEELLGAIKTQLSKQEMLKKQQNHALQQAISQLNNQVYYDSLTNLPNRLLLRERFEQIVSLNCQPSQRVPIAVLSLDQLNRLHQSLGSDVTDLLVQAACERIIPFAGASGTVARLNSEQLALILPPIAAHQPAEETAQALLKALAQPFSFMKYQVFLTGSLGMALYPEDGQDIDTLLKAAQAAMYQAHQRGGNSYQCYTPAMQEKSYDQLMLEMSLHHALEKEEFLVYYQPKIDLQTQTIVGAEALIRWKHPERGLISPGVFIPLAEETGLIVAIDEWILKTVCRQILTWKQVGISLSISVNLSGVQFNQLGFNWEIFRIIEAAGIEPQTLELELTESAVVKTPEVARTSLRTLKSLGVQLSLDDFGTGYSSLSYLQQFPFDTIKIDRSFIKNITQDPKNVVITTAIIELAHRLNLKVVAEGVETEAQQLFLRQLQCDFMQGYYFSPPVPVEILEKMLRETSSSPLK